MRLMERRHPINNSCVIYNPYQRYPWIIHLRFYLSKDRTYALVRNVIGVSITNDCFVSNSCFLYIDFFVMLYGATWIRSLPLFNACSLSIDCFVMFYGGTLIRFFFLIQMPLVHASSSPFQKTQFLYNELMGWEFPLESIFSFCNGKASLLMACAKPIYIVKV